MGKNRFVWDVQRKLGRAVVGRDSLAPERHGRCHGGKQSSTSPITWGLSDLDSIRYFDSESRRRLALIR